MTYFPFMLSAEESLAMINYFCTQMQKNKAFYLPLIEKATRQFIGVINLSPVSFEAHFTPAYEVGWRLVYDSWGRGYATEAAKILIDYGFAALQLDQVVSFTAVSNKRSCAVMERLGMTYDGEFDHPGLKQGDSLRRHALYRIGRGREL